MNKILSLDPSLTNTGWIVFGYFKTTDKWKEVEKGVIRTSSEAKKKNIRKTDDNFRRLKHITEELCDVCERHPEIKILVFEMAVGAVSATASNALAQSKTIVACMSVFYNIPAFHFLPNEIKKVAFKSGATKNDMISAALDWGIDFSGYESKRSKNGWNGEVEHIADAWGAFYTLLKNEPTVRLLEG